MEIFKFIPYLKPVIWGGKRIAALKNLQSSDENIGESWEISGLESHESVVAEGADRGLTLSSLIEKYGGALVGDDVYRAFGKSFPLLVKFIDANADLSVQVHPDDDIALKCHGCCGKTEMWYIVDADADARIYCGWARNFSAEQYVEKVSDNSIMEAVAAHNSQHGDAFFIPAGRVHSIGAGNLLVEVQQSSDITYRIYDYDRRDDNGNPRELHIENACRVMDYSTRGAGKIDYDRNANDVEVVNCEYFKVRRINVDGSSAIAKRADSFMIVINISGAIEIVADNMPACRLAPFESALIPASAIGVKIIGQSTVLTATV